MKFKTAYKIAGKRLIRLSLILTLTKIATIIISVNKEDTKVSNKAKKYPINNPIPPKICNNAIIVLNFL